jgi:hypothetical protein
LQCIGAKKSLHEARTQVEVFSAATKKTYFFPCNAWLRRDGADTSMLRREITAGAPDSAGTSQVVAAVVVVVFVVVVVVVVALGPSSHCACAATHSMYVGAVMLVQPM